MAENDLILGGKDRDPDLTSAHLLFQDDPAEKKPAQPPTLRVPVQETEETFDLAAPLAIEEENAGEMELAEPVPPPIPIPKPVRSKSEPTRAGTTQAPAEKVREEPKDLVEEVWSRPAEWAVSLLIVSVWLLGVAMFVYFASDTLSMGLTFLGMIVGLFIGVLLTYPILITLERPVRITPEQAVRDYYGALAHHFPHHRRMWLLLAKRGRLTPSYGSYEGFKAYWKKQLKILKSGHAGMMTPLVFEIENFRSEKPKGQSRVEVQYSVKVSVRGQRQEGPIGMYPAKITVVRGPDNMWYLESGLMPDKHRERKVIES